MAEQLVVMDGGRVLQSGPVEDVYYEPAVLRSAELVGFPRCTVIAGRVEDGVCVTKLARFPVALDAEIHDVAVMIRPEAIALDRRASASVGEIRLVENLGAESVVYLDAAGETLVTTAPSAAVAGLDIGDRLGFALRHEVILLYDRASGRRAGRVRESVRA